MKKRISNIEYDNTDDYLVFVTAQTPYGKEMYYMYQNQNGYWYISYYTGQIGCKLAESLEASKKLIANNDNILLDIKALK